MLWARIQVGERHLFGTVTGESLAVHSGDMFGAASATGEVIDLGQARWLKPCEPSKMLALWNNFREAAEKYSWEIPGEPLYFAKTANSFNVHLGPIPVPRAYEGRVVYEGELGIVIGHDATIFGYTCVNDVTALEIIARDPSFPQWTRAKSFDGFGPFGPVIATGLDPLTLRVRTLVNGRERQNYPVSDIIFPPAELVTRMARDLTLLPGDVIACGTSLGVLPMRPGATVEVEIEGIGVLRNVYG
jgi:2-keto-4-pentenoate hydratase/2-oxohepta-3-ene-1,7-dioic acid hydratase in catechol pathway